MENKPPAFQLYAQDWLVGTAHLTLEQQGAYMRLLGHQWVDGPLPNDLPAIARMLGVAKRQFPAIWAALERHFPVNRDGMLANPRLEAERAKLDEYRQHAADSGRRGANKRWHGDPNRVASRVAKQTPIAKGIGLDSSSSSSSGATLPLPPQDGAHAPPTKAGRSGHPVAPVASALAARLAS